MLEPQSSVVTKVKTSRKTAFVAADRVRYQTYLHTAAACSTSADCRRHVGHGPVARPVAYRATVSDSKRCKALPAYITPVNGFAHCNHSSCSDISRAT